MKYLSIQEAAKKLELSERSVRNYCQNGRIPGAVRQGKSWLIPIDAKKPERTNAKENELADEVLKTGYDLINFINNSPVSFLAVDNVRKILVDNGFVELFENQSSDLKPGDKVFFIRNGSSVVALDIGENLNAEKCPFHIIASHSDSPCFKIKPECDSKAGIYNRINVEAYGGLIPSTWLDRPLSIAGRVMVKKEDGLLCELVNLEEHTMMIPNTCIHFNHDLAKGYAYNLASDMQAFLGQELEGTPLKKMVADQLKIEVEDIVNFDLYLYNQQQGYLWGNKKEYISSSRLDDLECVFASTQALIRAHNPNAVNVLYIADNEEVGSSSRQGADSDFLEQVLKYACEQLCAPYNVSIANSFLVSADNAHAVHPNRPELSDPNNRPFMNKGIAIKFNASQSYTSDAVSGAIFQRLCENSKTPYQFFTNRSDMRGGSTLGNILLNHVSLLSVDVGLPQLAMHSSFETAGTLDVKYVIDVFKEFYSTNIEVIGNRYKINK